MELRSGLTSSCFFPLTSVLLVRLSALKNLSGQHWLILQSSWMCHGQNQRRFLWKPWVMRSAHDIRNMLAAVVWMYLIAEVRCTTVKQCCTDCEWLHCDNGGRNAFKPRLVLGGHNCHWSQVSSLMWGPKAFLQKIEHYCTNKKKSLSVMAIPRKSDSELVWHLHFAGCRQGERS